MEFQPVVGHPASEVLKEFAEGKLDDATAARVMRHLESCTICSQQVSTLSGDDFFRRMHQAQDREATPAPSETRTEANRPSSRPPGAGALNNLPPELAQNTQYEILGKLGEGGMGILYKARHRISGRLEVLKVMNKELIALPESKERFLREIQWAARLDHPNVVHMHTALELGELLVLVMEYVEGEDLAHLVKTRGPLSVPRACYYMQQVAEGLQYAFEEGLVHRDIKPENLMLARQGKKPLVKILDFGLAKARRENEEKDPSLTELGMTLGTPLYMAPEQARDAANADIRADLYSLGCTLYFLLTGSPPFAGKSRADLLLAHEMKAATPLDRLRPDVPEELAQVVAKLMAKEPSQRYQQPGEVVEALAPFVKSGALSESDSDASANPTPIPSRSTAPTKAFPDSRIEGRSTATPILGSSVRQTQVKNAKRIRKRLLLGALVLLLLAGASGLWLAGVFRGKTAEGILVIEVNEPDAEVYVDGALMPVAWSKEGRRTEMTVPPGMHRVEVRKAGFSGWTEEVEIVEGKRPVVTARLIPQAQHHMPPPGPGEVDLVARIKHVSGIGMLRIPSGEFVMGAEDGDKDEKPRHKVRISKPFWMGQYEVTLGQFKRFVEVTNYQTEGEKAGDRWTWRNPGFAQRDDHPVVCVSWNDANAYCQWLAKESGASIRLPHEAEWEYSCRAGTTTKYSFGDDAAALGDYAWYIDNNNPNGTKPCGQKKPNGFALYDMHGLVWEWCQDRYGEYAKEDQIDPKGPDKGDLRVLRGGAWPDESQFCRSADRGSGKPDRREPSGGFRVCFRPD